MLPYPQIDPVIVQIGPIALRWYGLMYLLGFTATFFLIRNKLNRERRVMEEAAVEDLMFSAILGLILGARIGYMIFYSFPELVQNPLSLMFIWRGGMSFHGGLIGVAIALVWFSRKRGIAFLDLADLLVIPAPIGLGLGRLGNFINAELWGRPTNVPWAMVFPGAGPEPRHPSQLYEFFLEGVVLFAVLWMLRRRLTGRGQMSGLFLLLYGFSRVFVEFFREPDPQLGFLFGLITMGQLLSGMMILAGCYILFAARGSKSRTSLN